MEELYQFEKAHTTRGIFKVNNKDQRTHEKLLVRLSAVEYEKYEKMYYGI